MAKAKKLIAADVLPTIVKNLISWQGI